MDAVETPPKTKTEHAGSEFVISWKIWTLFVACGAILVAMRTPGFWLHQGLYAEDGLIFFREQVIYGWTALFRPYAGYVHVIPRLIAMLAALAPAAVAPLIFAMMSALIQSASAFFFLLPENRVLVRSDRLRFAVCVLVLLDFPSNEMLNNIMDLQWFLMPVALLILLQVSIFQVALTVRRIQIYCVLMAFIGLTAPLLLLTLPLAIVAFVMTRPRSSERAIPLTLIAAIGIQTAVFLATPREAANGSGTHEALSVLTLARPMIATMGVWTFRDLIPLTLGIRISTRLAAGGGEVLAMMVFFGAVISGWVISRNWRRADRVLMACILGLTIAFTVTPLVVRHLLIYFADLYKFSFFDGGERYFLVPGWLLIVAVAMSVERWWPKRSGWANVIVLVAVFGVGTVANYRGEVLPDKHWSAQAPAVDEWVAERNRHLPMKHVAIPIVPDGWVVDLPERAAP